MNAERKPTNWDEGRRLRAWELSQEGWAQRRIAEALGASESSVSQWLKRARELGHEALRHRRPPGRPRQLTAEQETELVGLLKRGAEAFGYTGAVWTTTRVAEVIGQYFGVFYHPAHCSRLLRRLGWSVQKPIARATQRDEVAIAAWQSERWPALKKTPQQKGKPSSG